MSICLTYQKVMSQSKMMKSFLLIENVIPMKYFSLLNLKAEELKKNSEKVTRYESKGLPIVHHYKYVSELPVGHRFAMKKFHGILRYLRRDNVISMKQVVEPSPLNMEEMSGVHTHEYLKKFFNGLTSADEQRRSGFKWSPGLVQRCQYETGGTLLAAQIALQKGLACSTGGGTHHAFPSYGSGYCLVNDLAIAASQLKERGLAKKILIVDLDVHQGDGTAFIFQNNPDVFTLSMHCQRNFPLMKQKGDFDIELENFLEDFAYLAILKEHLPHVLNTFRPDFVLYDAGVDPHVNDELGHLNLSDQGLFDRDYYVLKLLASQSIPCATVVGGGYSTDREQLYIRHTIIHRAATKTKVDAVQRADACSPGEMSVFADSGQISKDQVPKVDFSDMWFHLERLALFDLLTSWQTKVDAVQRADACSPGEMSVFADSGQISKDQVPKVDFSDMWFHLERLALFDLLTSWQNS